MRFNRRSFIRSASLAAAGSAAGLRPFGALNALAQIFPRLQGPRLRLPLRRQRRQQHPHPVRHRRLQQLRHHPRPSGPSSEPAPPARRQLLQLRAQPQPSGHSDRSSTAMPPPSSPTSAPSSQPTTAASYQAGQTLPTNLFSHPDQQLEWQNAAQSGATQTGWAGRIADTLNTHLQPQRHDPDDHLRRRRHSLLQWQPAARPSPSAPEILAPANAPRATECGAQQATAQALLGFSSGLTLVQADNAITTNAYTYSKTLTNAVQSIPPLQDRLPHRQRPRRTAPADRAESFRSAPHSELTARSSSPASATSTHTPTSSSTSQRFSPRSAPHLPPSTRPRRSSASRTTSPPSPCPTLVAPSSPTPTPASTTPGARTTSSSEARSMAARCTEPSPHWLSEAPTTPALTAGGSRPPASVQYAATLAQWFGVTPAQLPDHLP